MGQTRVHRILNEVGALAFPGVFDTLSAKIASRAGFPMAFVSGYSVAATAIGEPDMGLLTQTEMIDRARRICMSVSIPHHRRCRHRLRQPAERPPNRPRADRRRGRRLLPGGPGLAEEVRAHARQAGDRARRLRPEDPGGGRSPRGPRLLHRRPHGRPRGRRPRRGHRRVEAARAGRCGCQLRRGPGLAAGPGSRSAAARRLPTWPT